MWSIIDNPNGNAMEDVILSGLTIDGGLPLSSPSSSSSFGIHSLVTFSNYICCALIVPALEDLVKYIPDVHLA